MPDPWSARERAPEPHDGDCENVSPSACPSWELCLPTDRCPPEPDAWLADEFDYGDGSLPDTEPAAGRADPPGW